MTQPLTTFRANLSFQTEEDIAQNTEHGTEVVFQADDKAQAIKDIRRWWHARHASWPEWFGTLGCVKIYPYIITPIDDAGSCRTGTQCGPFYEWKMDTLGRGEGPIHFLLGE